MTDLKKEFAYNNLLSAVNDYNVAVDIYSKHNTEANEYKVKEKKAFLTGYISAYQTLGGEVVNLFYENIFDKYPIITSATIV